MYEWNEAVQKMIDWIEENLTEDPTLLQMSQQIGYSPYYCSVQFHRVCGKTIRSYLQGRRLALAAKELLHTSDRILDIAMKYGFSSQEALTRAFRKAFGCTPASYRKNPHPVPLPIRKETYSPWHHQTLHKGEKKMKKDGLTTPKVRVEYIPAHKYIGIWEDKSHNYGDFWQYHNCDEVCGIIESMSNVSHPVVTPHTAGWYKKDGERRYFYGLGVPEQYDGEIPKGFEIKEFPGSYYLVFYHPPFDYLEDNGEVMKRVEDLAWNYDLKADSAFRGVEYEWNEDVCQCYQRHYPEGIGYEVLRPVKLK